MRYAYLILVHHEFELLKLLLNALDDERNDLYLHFDKKVKSLPSLETKNAGLTILDERIDIRWGHSSMIEAEFCLLDKALSSGKEYAYLHFISGVDLPIKSQDYIDNFFTANKGKEFVGYYNGGADSSPIERKVQRTHLFSDSFKGSGLLFQLKRIIRFAYIRFQYLFNIQRNKYIDFKKGTQWCSITSDFARYLLSKRGEALEIYKDSFCCDEIVVQTYLWHSPFRENIYDSTKEMRGCKRYIPWENNQLLDITAKHLPHLVESEALFARKFNYSDPQFIQQVLDIQAKTE